MPHRFLRRRRFLIKPANQLRLTMVLVISFLVYSAILGFIVFYPLAAEFSTAANFEEQARLSTEVLHLHARLWPAVIVIAMLVGLQVVFMSHRFFGPIYRFEVALREFLEGEFSHRIKLRKHDNLKDMEGLINAVAEQMEGACKRASWLQASSERRLAEALDMLGAGEPEKAGQARAVIAEVLSDVRSSRDLFKGAGSRPGGR